MGAIQLTDGIFWVGAVDWNIRYFHGPAYSTHRGTTYNSYLIVDDKVTLVDTVYGPFADVMVKNIADVLDPASIDYVISNHVETDHPGGIPKSWISTLKRRYSARKRVKKDFENTILETGTITW